jgi:hypothetical protein
MLTWVTDPVAHYYEHSTTSPGSMKAVGLVVNRSGLNISVRCVFLSNKACNKIKFFRTN